jgi:hypothetical protein
VQTMIFIASGDLPERELTDFPSSAVRSYDDLIIAIRAVKEFLGLSNETLEEIAGLTRGHVDKIIGPSREKKIGPQTLALILGALGIRLRVEVDPEQARCVASRWTRRNELQVRRRQPLPALWFADEDELGNGRQTVIPRSGDHRQQNGAADKQAAAEQIVT